MGNKESKPKSVEKPKNRSSSRDLASPPNQPSSPSPSTKKPESSSSNPSQASDGEKKNSSSSSSSSSRRVSEEIKKVEEKKNKKESSSVLMFLFVPILFCFLLFSFALFPASFPSFKSKALRSAEDQAYVRAISIASVEDGFTLGMLYLNWTLNDCENNNRTLICNSIHKNATDVTGFEFGFDALDYYFLASSQKKMKQASGFFTLTNTLLVIGAFLVAISIVPVLMLFCFPLLKEVWSVAWAVMNTRAAYIAYEYLIYALAFYVLLWARSFNTTGFVIAFTSNMISCIGFGYSLLGLHRSSRPDDDTCTSLSSMFFCYVFGVTAVIFDSSFLGLLSYVGLFATTGFFVFPTGLCYYIGFKDKSAIQVSAVVAYILLIPSLILRMGGLHKLSFIRPFQFGVFSFGTSIFFLAHLIYASKWYKDNDHEYLNRQVYFVAPALIFFVLGTVFGIPALSNTCGVFMFLYAMEKYCELAAKHFDMVVLFVLFGGVILYGVSLFLRVHPDYISLMFSS